MTPKLSIIILNWNTGVYLEKCLRSIFSGPPREWLEVIVVDNNSKEEISHILEEFQSVNLIRNKYNLGFAAGNNVGFRASQGEYVMTLNPDTVLGENTLETLVKVLDDDNSVGIAAATLDGVEVRRSQYTFRALFCSSLLALRFEGLRKQPGEQIETKPFDVELVNGTGYICRRSALFEDRFFKEDHFLFGEEYSLCKHVREQGFKIRVVPQARLEHSTSVTFRSDHNRLKVAVKLGTAVVCRIRQTELGAVTGRVETLIRMIEAGAFTISLSAVNLFEKTRRRERSLMLTRLNATVAASFMMLIAGEKYLARVNREAGRFFNDGAAEFERREETD